MEELLKHMNEEKRDKIINAAIEEFSKFPYAIASTNNIVKNAGISKGLLFHYFGSKKELYDKLIEFVLAQLMVKIKAEIDWEKTDIFIRIKQLIIAKFKMCVQFPNMFDFILKVIFDNSVKTNNEILKFYSKYGIDGNKFLAELFTKNIDYSLFREQKDLDKKINIIRWTLEKYSEDQLKQYDQSKSIKEVDFQAISDQIDVYIKVLKDTFY